MDKALSIEHIQELVLEIDGNRVLLDRDVAALYGVETRDINKAVKNNPDKFPDGYVIVTTKVQKEELVENFHRFANLKHSTTTPKAFTEKGLYMLATILSSKKAVQTTIAIIETFAQLRELSRNVKALSETDNKQEQQSLMQKSGEIIADILDDSLSTDESETTIELNFAVLKFKHTVKKRNNEK
jgi:phage regulator Rha-like protein